MATPFYILTGSAGGFPFSLTFCNKCFRDSFSSSLWPSLSPPLPPLPPFPLLPPSPLSLQRPSLLPHRNKGTASHPPSRAPSSLTTSAPASLALVPQSRHLSSRTQLTPSLFQKVSTTMATLLPSSLNGCLRWNSPGSRGEPVGSSLGSPLRATAGVGGGDAGPSQAPPHPMEATGSSGTGRAQRLSVVPHCG